MFGMESVVRLIVSATTLPFIIILLVLILVLMRGARKAGASNSWPSTTGRITSSFVGSHRSLNSNGTHTTIYEPEIAYEYAINGQTYQGKQLDFGMISGTSSTGWADGIVSRYPNGSPVQVFYNPDKPDEAVLQHGGGGGNTLLMVILMGVEVILVGILVAGWTGRMG